MAMHKEADKYLPGSPGRWIIQTWVSVHVIRRKKFAFLGSEVVFTQVLFRAELKPRGYYLEHAFYLEHVIFTIMSHVYYLDQ